MNHLHGAGTLIYKIKCLPSAPGHKNRQVKRYSRWNSFTGIFKCDNGSPTFYLVANDLKVAQNFYSMLIYTARICTIYRHYYFYHEFMIPQLESWVACTQLMWVEICHTFTKKLHGQKGTAKLQSSVWAVATVAKVCKQWLSALQHRKWQLHVVSSSLSPSLSNGTAKSLI